LSLTSRIEIDALLFHESAGRFIMRKIALLVLMSAVLISIPGMLRAQEVYYVQSQQAKIMSGPSFKSTVIGKASRGIKLLSSGREGYWIKVSFYTREGYVPAILLSQHPPLRRIGLIKADEGNIRQSVHRRASSYTTAAAARGLATDDRRRLSRNEKTDYASLEKIETFAVSPEDISRFMEGDLL
jgi:hypothetical protein